MRVLALMAPVLLFAPLAMVSCHPKNDSAKSDAAAARAGGGPVDVSTVPVDESVATPTNQLSAGDQSSGADAQPNATPPSSQGR